MIHIGKSYINHAGGGMARLCADVTIGDRRNTLWFAVRESQERYLAVGRADAFVMGFLAAAMRGNHEIVCEDPMSERLHYQFNQALIPALSFAGERYHRIHIAAPLTAEPYPNLGAVGGAFSSGVDSLYTIMTHGRESEFQITHIAVYNCSHYDQFGEKREKKFLAGCRQAEEFARAYGLETVIVDTNFFELLGSEPRSSVFNFRNVACTLALQGLFSRYLLSSGCDARSFSLNADDLDERNICYRFDVLTLASSNTETLTFYLSGIEAKRWQKMRKLADWEPSWRWLHPCWLKSADKMNCGHCGKCVVDLVTLYAMGPDVLDRYSRVYDISSFLRHLPQRIAYVMVSASNKDSPTRVKEALWLLMDSGAVIPPATYVYAKQFRRALGNLNYSETEVSIQ